MEIYLFAMGLGVFIGWVLARLSERK